MASISSLSSSSSSSIYGNRSYNIISGLASGLDTEAMIEGLVQSYQQKIQNLQKDNTKLQWQKDAYRSISDKLVEFSRNYTSFTYGSTTNLMSNSFFTNAVKTTANGVNANLVSAVGKSTSQVTINSISELATATRYTHSFNAGSDLKTESLAKNVSLSNLSGSLTLSYGDKSVSISFGEQDIYNTRGEFVQAIKDKLAEQKVTIDGQEYTADQLFTVQDDGSSISFEAAAGGPITNATVSITGASGKLNGLMEKDADDKFTGIGISSSTTLSETQPLYEYLSGKSFSFTLDGTKKSITVSGASNIDDFVTTLQKELNKAFGGGKVTVQNDNGALSFSGIANGSTFSMSISDTIAQKELGIGSGLTNYVDTSKTLGELGVKLDTITDKSITINGVTLSGTYDENTTLDQIMKDINNSDAGVEVSYSKTSGQFVFTASETGAGRDIKIGGDLGKALFGEVPEDENDNYKRGTDAKLNVTVNGKPMDIIRSSNTFDLDGMSVTLNGTFTPASDTDKITFTSKTDADTVVDAVKKMVTDLNALLTEIKSAYSDMPLKQANGSAYEPLSDKDMEDMSETAIKNYEEKAKTGILFMDSDLSSLYNALRSAITPGGADGEALRSIGLKTSYADGLTTITLDEKALREALETNPDKVQEVFTKSTKTGAATDGLMAKLQSVTDRYASTTGEPKGILIQKAGSKYAATSELKNTMLDKMKDIEEQIAKWQDKMSNQVDYYTNKFTQLELLINRMNAQSSTLSGLMGGY